MPTETRPGALAVRPVSITEALAWIRKHHAHHHPPQSGLFAVSVAEGDRRCCVALASRPVARMLDRDPTCCEVSRVASDGTKHAASKAIAAIARGALALGYRRLVSYTILGELGTCYRAAGWRPCSVTGTAEGWMRHPRATTHGSLAQPRRKIRWEFGPDAAPPSDEAEDAIRAHAGDYIPPKLESALPLFDAEASA